MCVVNCVGSHEHGTDSKPFRAVPGLPMTPAMTAFGWTCGSGDGRGREGEGTCRRGYVAGEREGVWRLSGNIKVYKPMIHLFYKCYIGVVWHSGNSHTLLVLHIVQSDSHLFVARETVARQPTL